MPALKLYWDNVPNAVSYNVYWSTSPGVTVDNGNPITGITNIVYHHTSLLENTSYYYIVAAVDAAGNIGPASTEFSAKSSEITGIEIQPTGITLLPGQTQQYTSNLVYSSGDTVDVTIDTTWDTSDHSIATITNSGLATAVSTGNVNILATADGYSDSIVLGVNHILVSISISPSSPSVNVSSTQQFTATGHYNDATTADITTQVSWASSDPGKATINSAGLATGVSHGMTSITASLGPIHNSVVLTVNTILQSITVTPSNPAITYPNTQQFTATGHYNDSTTADLTSTATWTSGTPSVATINSSGLLTPVSTGTTLVTATQSAISGNTTASISNSLPVVSGLQHWIKSDAGVTVDGSNNVVTWADQSGNGNNWAQNAGTVQLISNAQNGLPVVRSGTAGSPNNLSTSAFIFGTQEAEVFVIIKANTISSDTNYAWSGFGNDGSLLNHYGYTGGTEIYEVFGNSIRQGPNTVPNSGNALRAYGIYNVSSGTGANNYILRLNGTQIDIARTGNPAWHNTTFWLFAGIFNQSFQFQGDIGEVIIYDHVLTSGDRTSIYNYLQNRWNTPNGV